MGKGDQDSIPLESFAAPTNPAGPKFQENSCIVLIGTTGCGKTTAMNLYTGNKAAARTCAKAVTEKGA